MFGFEFEIKQSADLADQAEPKGGFRPLCRKVPSVQQRKTKRICCGYYDFFKTKVLGFMSPRLGLRKMNDPNPRGFDRMSTNEVIVMNVIG